jgi:hypothetical protein
MCPHIFMHQRVLPLAGRATHAATVLNLAAGCRSSHMSHKAAFMYRATLDSRHNGCSASGRLGDRVHSEPRGAERAARPIRRMFEESACLGGISSTGPQAVCHVANVSNVRCLRIEAGIRSMVELTRLHTQAEPELCVRDAVLCQVVSS